MSELTKTTLYLPDADYRRLKALPFAGAARRPLDLRHFGAVTLRGRPGLLPRDLDEKA